ncbi:LBP [Mytilus edulis]|uniref:LBP n=1 Tax=Mytilus edulis TaxID=6550 RepID=A0A8S3SN24_MYTED|nr:LBP [Mytilus edulis]
MSFSVGINTGVDGNGRPTIKSAQCACNSGHVKFKFHGGRAWIYNTFAGKVSKAISNQFQKKVKLGKVLTLDYRLMSAPKATPQYMEASLKIGKAFPNSTVELHMLSTKPPVTNISVGVLGVRAEGNITLLARKSDKSLHYLFTIYADKALQFLVDSAIITTIEPMINGLGTKGFPMPSTKDLQFQQSGIKLLPVSITCLYWIL